MVNHKCLFLGWEGSIPSLTAALTSFQVNSDRRLHCYQNLTISEAFCAQLIDGIDLLAIERGLDRTSRTIAELS